MSMSNRRKNTWPQIPLGNLSLIRCGGAGPSHASNPLLLTFVLSSPVKHFPHWTSERLLGPQV